MFVILQSIPTPRGHVLGYKAVRESRQSIYCSNFSAKYTIGTTHTAYDVNSHDKWHFKSARKLKRLRAEQIERLHTSTTDSPFNACLPGIHVCKTAEEARIWLHYSRDIIIPVAYTLKSMIGMKSPNTVVVYRIKVLG